MKFIIIFVLALYTVASLPDYSKIPPELSTDWLKCIKALSPLIADVQNLVTVIQTKPVDVEKAIHYSAGIVKDLPDFLNYCVMPDVWKKNLTLCIDDFEQVALALDKLIVAIINKDTGSIIENALTIILDAPKISDHCFNKPFPIVLEECLGDVMSAGYHVQFILSLFKMKPFDYNAFVDHVLELINSIPTIAKDCMKEEFPMPWYPCAVASGDMAKKIGNLVSLFFVKPIVIPEVIKKAQDIIDFIPNLLSKCAPKLAPFDKCIAGIDQLIDEATDAVLEAFKKPINFEALLSKIGKIVGDFPKVAHECHH